MHTPQDLNQSSEPAVLQPEDGHMEDNKEQEEEEDEEEEERSTCEDGESDMMEEREPQLEILVAPNIEGTILSMYLISPSHF